MNSQKELLSPFYVVILAKNVESLFYRKSLFNAEKRPLCCLCPALDKPLCKTKTLTLSNRLANLICVSFIARRTNTVSSVVPSLTDSINAALVVVNTRVLALLGDTGQNTGAVAVHRTLGLALRIGVSLKSRRTGAATVVSVAPSNSVNSTRVGIAGIADVWLDGRWTPALHQGVADVARQTGADRRVSSDFTSGVSSTDPRAGVVAVQVLAGHVGWTVWVNDTLWFALGVWVALVVGRTGAFAVVSNLARNGAGPAGVGITRIGYLWFS